MNDKEVQVDSVSLDDTVTEQQTADVVDETQEDTIVEQLNAQIAELNDKYLRVAAELENTRRRAAIDADASARNRAMSVARHFLPLVDAVYAASAHNPDDEGIKSMVRAVESACGNIGMVKIESVGQKLNPQFHNAVQVVETENTESNTIVEEMQSGYMFGDTVLRPAMVVVAK
ncbi:MAG: nucleotide exchange factor GrpE [Alphaproteobacteria bacterium]|nr:nucleotide exchange factor GrpE [Alphaproteobacteria bacterium]